MGRRRFPTSWRWPRRADFVTATTRANRVARCRRRWRRGSWPPNGWPDTAACRIRRPAARADGATGSAARHPGALGLRTPIRPSRRGPPIRVKNASPNVDDRAMDSFAETSESESIDPELVAESTEPQYAPERRVTPVAPPATPSSDAPPPRGNERSRRPTLASPIPALMAASMRMQGPAADGNSGASLAPSGGVDDGVPMMAEPQMTSRLGEHTRVVLLQGES